jgi:multiple antibiotic resistance protein
LRDGEHGKSLGKLWQPDDKGRRKSRLRTAAVALFLSALSTPLLLQAEAFAQVADEARVSMTSFGPRRVFLLLFLMLGPIKILMPFVAMTKGAGTVLRGRLATRAMIYSVIILLLAGLFGRVMMTNFNVSVPVLALAGGLVLFLVALQTVLQQTLGSGSALPQFQGEPGLHLALSPLAFPTIVTPYGIAALIVFATLASGDRSAELMIAVIVLIILAMDWLAMIFAAQILRWLGTALQILAVVLGIGQVAIGLQVIFQSLRLLGVVAGETG